MKRCRFPFIGPEGLESRSGPTVLHAALSEALRGDARFLPLDVAHGTDIVEGPLDGEPEAPAHSTVAQGRHEHGRMAAWYPTYAYLEPDYRRHPGRAPARHRAERGLRPFLAAVRGRLREVACGLRAL